MKSIYSVGLFRITLFLMMFIVKNIDCSDHHNPQALHRLTKESYISPEMQWDILSFLGKDSIAINKITGAAQDFPSTDFILQVIQKQLELPMDSVQKESMKSALHAMFEATGIAIFVASIEAAYQDQKFIMYQSVNAQLSASLDAQKQAIQAAMDAINAKITVDQPAQTNSYYTWFFGSNTPKKSSVMSNMSIPLDPDLEDVIIPAEFMPTIIKTNNYKELSDATQAANLLFKQCFIAQQHHLKDLYRINEIRVNLNEPVSATNYIYTHFPDIYNKEKNNYPICQIAQNLVGFNATRTSLDASLTQEQIQAHKLLLHIRQAIQTALYIANKKSSFNMGNLIPSSVLSYLDGITSQLMQYDAQLSILCKDPKYGATAEDIYQDEQWAMISKIAAGIVVTAAVVGTTMYFGPMAAGYVKQAANYFVGGTNSSTTPTTSTDQGQSSATSSWLPSWMSGTTAPVQGPALPPTTLQTIGQYAGTAAQYAGTAKMATNAIMQADKSGMLGTPGLIDQTTGGAIKMIDTIAGKTVTYGSAINSVSNMDKIINSVYENPTNLDSLAKLATATGSIAGATSQAIGDTRGYLSQLTGNPELITKIQNDLRLYSSTANQGANAYYAAKDIKDIAQGNYTKIFNAGSRLYNAYFKLNPVYLNIANYTNPPQETQDIKLLAPQILYAGFVRMIEDAISQKLDPASIIANASIDLLKRKKTDEDTLLAVLQKLEQDYAQKIPMLQKA